MAKRVKLADQTGMFQDPDTGFILVRDEIREYPKKPGHMTKAWLNGGGLLVVDDPLPEPVPQPAPKPQPEAPTPPDAPEPDPESAPERQRADWIELRIPELEDDLTIKEMKTKLDELGLEYNKRARQRELATALAEHEWENLE